MKITTKTGDRGQTGLFGGRRVSKASTFIELVGELDELQSYVGWARCGMNNSVNAAADRENCVPILDRVQDDLYRMMSIAGFEMKCPDNVGTISREDVEFLENYIADGQKTVKDLNKFIRPGLCEVAARLHICRTVCRRVERNMVAADNACGTSSSFIEMLKYLNRLSDLLFVMAYKFEK